MNGKRLVGLDHVAVVDILKNLPQHVRIVCSRRDNANNAQIPPNAEFPDSYAADSGAAAVGAAEPHSPAIGK